MTRYKIDEKHHIEAKVRIVKTTNNEPIPLNEPVILFRARDKLALPLLIMYRRMCEADEATEYQLESMDRMIAKFRKFAEDNPQVMKQPGVTRGK